MTTEYDELDERSNYSLLEAIKFWLPRENFEEHNIKNYTHLKDAVEDYARKNKFNVNVPQPPVIWLRLFLEVRSNYCSLNLPKINPDAINSLLKLEQNRQEQDKFLLYYYINPVNQKSRGPRKQRTPDRAFLGYNTLEILLNPKPTKEPQCWPYYLNWKTIKRSRLKKGNLQKSNVDSYKLTWGKLTPLLEKILKVEVDYQDSTCDDAILILAKSTNSRIYKSTVTAKNLATHLIEKYSEVGNYALNSVTRVLSCYVEFPKGRPKKIIKKQKK